MHGCRQRPSAWLAGASAGAMIAAALSVWLEGVHIGSALKKKMYACR